MQEPRQKAAALSEQARSLLRLANPDRGLSINTDLDCAFTRQAGPAIQELEDARLIAPRLQLGPIQSFKFTPAGVAVRAYLLHTGRRAG